MRVLLALVAVALALGGSARGELEPPEFRPLMPGTVVSHEAILRLASSGELWATDRLTLEPLPPDGVARFWLHPALEVTRAVGGRLTRNGGKLEVRLSGGPLEIEWQGRLPAGDEQWVGPAGAFLQEEGRWHPNHYGPHGPSTLEVQVPEGWVLASPAAGNGTLRFPAGTCGMALAAGPYRVEESPRIRLLTYGPPPPGLAERARSILERLEGLFGPFASRRLDVVECPGAFGGGLTGLVMLPTEVLADPGSLDDFLAHEISHSWWGGAVPGYSTDGLWYEALAEYSAGLITGRELRAETEAAWPPGGATPLREARSYEPWEEADLVAYRKGALFLASLRQAMGDRAFFAGLRSFATERQGRLSGWRDLQEAWEQASGRDLEALFHLWLDGRDLPAGTP